MPSILVDSDIVIDYLRGFESAKSFFKESFQNRNLFLSVINIAEIYSGRDTKKPVKDHAIVSFLNNFQIAVVTPTIAKSAGILKRDYNAPFADALVAATALEYDFQLATRNIKHFKNIKRLKLLKPY